MTANSPEALINRLWWLTLLRGVLTLALGLCALSFMINPDVGGIFLVVTVGWFALVAGAVLVYGAFQLRRARPELAALLAG